VWYTWAWNIKVYLMGEIGCEDVDCSKIAQNRIQLQKLVKMAIKLLNPQWGLY
jgi:hypothetical protein